MSAEIKRKKRKKKEFRIKEEGKERRERGRKR